MKRSVLVSLVVVALLGMALPALAVEAFIMREADNPKGPAGAPIPCALGANRNGSCSGSSLAYRWYNVCNGYIWIFTGWSAGEAVGVQYGGPTMPCITTFPSHIVKRVIYYFRNVVANYAQTVDCYLKSDCNGDGCPESVLGSQLNLDPALRWNCVNYNVCVPCSYLIGEQSHDGGTAPSFATDGPFKAVCDPTHPPPHSYYYGVGHSTCVPWVGVAATDPDDFLQWVVVDTYGCIDAVEPTSWGALKGMYR